MFKTGDIVEITAEAAATGMLDFWKGKAYEVIGASSTGSTVRVIDESGRADWYHCTHFKLKEDTKLEKKECLFKEGQVVWDSRKGRGTVACISSSSVYPVEVSFDNETRASYTKDGKFAWADIYVSLYFSEPKIEAATEPLFEPTLKKGSVVIANDGDEYRILYLKVEEEDRLVDYNGKWYSKNDWEFYTLGEKINFK